MRESDLYPKIKNKFIQKDPNAWIYKIPDTAGLGGRRPFDMIVLSHGIFMAVEVKLDDPTENKYQTYNLELIRKAGGLAFLINFKHNKQLSKNMDKFIDELIQYRDLKNSKRKEADKYVS